MNTGNRVLWSIVGAVLLAAGIVGVLASQGRLSDVDKGQPLLTTGMIDRWNSSSALSAGLTIAGGLLLAILGALLLRAQLRGRGGSAMRDLTFQPSLAPEEPGPTTAGPGQQPDSGRTEVASSALHHALERDLQTDRHVRRAAVRLTGGSQRPQLRVRLAVTPDADIARVASHLDRAVHRFTTTSGVTPDLSDVVVRIPAGTATRVQ
jgi:hypothetical protein